MKKTTLLTFVCIAVMAMAAHAGSVIVIANKGVPVSSITAAEIQNIFLGKDAVWSNGKKMVPVVLKEGPTNESFMQDFLSKRPIQFDNYWKKAIFTGTGRPPKALGSEAEMVQFVSGTEGAIGYISSDTPHGDVKKLDVK